MSSTTHTAGATAGWRKTKKGTSRSPSESVSRRLLDLEELQRLRQALRRRQAFLKLRDQLGEELAFLARADTRDADVEIRDDKAADLLALIKESLRERRFGLAVRLEVASSMPSEMVEYLTNSLRIDASAARSPARTACGYRDRISSSLARS